MLTFLSYNNFIDDTTFQETLHTLDIIKNTNDKDGEYIDIYISLLWDLLQDGMKNKLNKNQFNEIINHIYIPNKPIYSFIMNIYMIQVMKILIEKRD